MVSWIEFEGENNTKISIRPEYINMFEQTGNNTTLYIEDGDESMVQVVNESYKQVKEKILKEDLCLYGIPLNYFNNEEIKVIGECLAHYWDTMVIEGDEKVEFAKLQNKVEQSLISNKEDK